MKILFFLGVLLFILFEVAKVYFILPVPGSQEMNSIDLAYILHANRWIIRGVTGLLIVAGIREAWNKSKWLTGVLLFIAVSVGYLTHFNMAADTMFYQPKNLRMVPAASNKVETERLIIGISLNGDSKAYPIQFLGYHHQIQDTIAGKPVMITYCNVCRSGRVFEPMVNQKFEKFRLVGMDHYNAMFEDATTRSWWRQATGEAIAGPLKGQFLPEFPSQQTTLSTWLSLYPKSLIMQPDSHFISEYDVMSDFESGRMEGRLTRYDSASWGDKSWIAGVCLEDICKAYDWNELTSKNVINDHLGPIQVSIVLSRDQKSLFAFQRNSIDQLLYFRNDTLTDGQIDFAFSGKALDTSSVSLTPLQVYQEYWHSWRTFHPESLK